MNTTLKQLWRSTAVGLVLFFSAIALTQAYAQDYEKKEQLREEEFNNVVKELNLSSEQLQQITVQRNREKAESLEVRTRFKGLRDELGSELDKEHTDKAKIYMLLAQMKELAGKRMERKIEGILALKEILTPAQFKALNEKKKQWDPQKRRYP